LFTGHFDVWTRAVANAELSKVSVVKLLGRQVECRWRAILHNLKILTAYSPRFRHFNVGLFKLENDVCTRDAIDGIPLKLLKAAKTVRRR
jgi:hypothetical protein